jgi:hypothetical protein
VPVVHQQDVRAAWARLVAVVASSISGLYLLMVLGLGAAWVTMDWSALACFDGDESACANPSQADAGLAAVQASSWILGSIALMATLGAIVLTLRLRRVAHVVPVLALCVTSAIVTQVLWSRV